MKAAVICLAAASMAAAQPAFGPAIEVESADGPVVVDHFASPCMADWDGDGLDDLIVTEGYSLSSNCLGRFRLYINQGQPGAPVFEGYSFMEADGERIELTSP